MLACKLGIVLIMAQQMLAQWLNIPGMTLPDHKDKEYRWYPAEGGELSCKDPLWAGWGQKIDNIFIGRAWYNGNLLPAKVMPKRGVAFVGLHGKEYTNSSYEVLCGSRSNWEKASHGDVPRNAFPVGKTSQGTTLYYGRARFRKGLHPGKVDRQQKGILIPFKGSEYQVYQYEVLVTKRPRWLG